MASIQVALVRHGSFRQPEGVPSAHLPHPLTEQGREEARSGAERLAQHAHEAGFEIERVIDASTLLRAYETAVLFASKLAERGLGEFRVEQFDALTERSLGSMANLTEAEIEAIVAADPRASALPERWKRSSDLRLPFPGAESLNDAGRRVARHIEQRVQESSGALSRLKVVVGHGGAFRHAARELGVLSEGDVAALSMYHAEPVYLERRQGHWQQVAGRWKPRSGTSE
jgi:2,3-bisphosphoglycerate-dependent phosphoglycerate mutase